MAKKPTEIEGIDPLTTGKRAHGEDVQGNSILNKKAVVKSAPKTAKKAAIKTPVDEPGTQTPVEDPKIAETEPAVDEFGEL